MPARPPALLLSLLAVAGLLILGGCGEKSEPEIVAPVEPQAIERPTEPDEPRPPVKPRAEAEAAAISAVVGFFTSGDPALVCDRYSTQGLLRRSFGGRAGCRASTTPRSAAERVEASKVRLTESGATLTAAVGGGPSGGQRIRVTLLFDGNQWRVDRLRSNVPVGP